MRRSLWMPAQMLLALMTSPSASICCRLRECPVSWPCIPDTPSPAVTSQPDGGAVGEPAAPAAAIADQPAGEPSEGLHAEVADQPAGQAAAEPAVMVAARERPPATEAAGEPAAMVAAGGASPLSKHEPGAAVFG